MDKLLLFVIFLIGTIAILSISLVVVNMNHEKIVLSENEINCTDNDGGLNYVVAGTVNFKDSNSKNVYLDTCLDNSTLLEYYCDGVNLNYTKYRCKYECITGACNRCINECQELNSTQCFENNSYRNCGNYDTDNCLEWGSIVDCPLGKFCQNGECKIKTNCNQKDFKMAFILLVKGSFEATKERIDKLNEIKDNFSRSFAYATGNLATMDTSDDVAVIKLEDYTTDSAVTKKFYETHDDVYDFISIYTTFDIEGEKGYQHHNLVRQDIIGIGLSTYDNSAQYGSKGKLKGVNFMEDIDMYYTYQSDSIGYTAGINGLLHETGHQWCCYVGDNFAQGKNNARLEIIQQDIHYYRGLQSPYETGTPMDSDYWIANGDGTYHHAEYIDAVKRYHPFTLYFMGLLPEEKYSTKFQLYDAGPIGNWTFTNAVPYKEVSVNDIIDVAGQRLCV